MNLCVRFLGESTARQSAYGFNKILRSVKLFATDFIFRQHKFFVDNQKCQAGFRPLCNKILFLVDRYMF